ncbi:hypothetical protein Tco_0704567 [Tanacetum coccineum]|uniref:Xylulose kinase-1 n=1 Tax=Tanacetum coccineum TaxID=301880 RepID=A0ABQ4Y2D2_9ASTR
MTTLKFADTHNMVAFLSKPAKSEGFEQILDFLNAHTIKYALTINPTIYTSCIEQFWATVKAKTVNGKVQLQALVDGKKVIITEYTMRRYLQQEDAEGVDCLPNAAIFEQLALMSSKTTAWNEFSSTMASAIICLATNQKFNFSKYIFESMVKNLDSVGNFLMYLRVGKGFSGMETPLFPTIMVQAQKEMGEGSTIPTDPHHTPIIIQPSTSQPQKTQKSRRPKRKDTEVPHPSGFTTNVADEAVNEEMDDKLKSAKPKADKVVIQEPEQGTTTPTLTTTIGATTITAVSTRPIAKGLVIHEHEQAPTPTVSSQQPSQVKVQDKGKGKMVAPEPVKKMSKKELLRLDEELAFKLQAEEEEEERLAREKVQQVEEANIA